MVSGLVVPGFLQCLLQESDHSFWCAEGTKRHGSLLPGGMHYLPCVVGSSCVPPALEGPADRSPAMAVLPPCRACVS